MLGGPLEPCGTDPVTGYYRDGNCSCGPEDVGLHAVCAVMTPEFLEHQRSVGNDLSTPMPEYGFAGLHPGDRWCVVAARWLQAYQAASPRPSCSPRPTPGPWSWSRSSTSTSTPSTCRGPELVL